MNDYFDRTTKAGTITGTLLTVVNNIRTEDLVKTAILAAVGALVSFVVTLGLKFLTTKIRK